MNVFLYLFMGALTIGTSIDKMSTESNKQKENCLTIENFNSITDYIKDHGEQTKLSKRVLSDKESLSLEISLGNRFIELEDYQDYKRIIIIDKSKDNEIPPYFVSSSNNQIQISAYYSRLDDEKDVKTRAEDWCKIISEFTHKK